MTPFNGRDLDRWLTTPPEDQWTAPEDEIGPEDEPPYWDDDARQEAEAFDYWQHCEGLEGE